MATLVSFNDDGSINLLDGEGSTLVTCQSNQEARAFSKVIPVVQELLDASSDPRTTIRKLNSALGVKLKQYPESAQAASVIQ